MNFSLIIQIFISREFSENLNNFASVYPFDARFIPVKKC